MYLYACDVPIVSPGSSPITNRAYPMKAALLGRFSAWETNQTYAESFDFGPILSVEAVEIQQHVVCDANLDRYRDIINELFVGITAKELAPYLNQTDGALLRKRHCAPTEVNYEQQYGTH
jgi:hypothetical protein